MNQHTVCVSTLSPSERVSETLTIVGARLTAEQSLAVFRVLLSAASRPGTLVDLPADVAPGAPRVVVPVLALADLDVAVATLGDDEAHETRWSTLITAVTGCRNAAPADADIVVALRKLHAGDVAELRAGTAEAPELGARLFVACDSLGGGPEQRAVTVRLRGPGVPSSRTLMPTGIDGDVFAALGETNRAFPAGIDTWLVSAGGVVAAIPRSTRIELVDEPGGTQ